MALSYQLLQNPMGKLAHAKNWQQRSTEACAQYSDWISIKKEKSVFIQYKLWSCVPSIPTGLCFLTRGASILVTWQLVREAHTTCPQLLMFIGGQLRASYCSLLIHVSTASIVLYFCCSRIIYSICLFQFIVDFKLIISQAKFHILEEAWKKEMVLIANSRQSYVQAS
jgi:hypothetical protein